MQQRTYDFLAKLKVPMLTFGGELMGEAVEMVVDDLNSHRFMSMRDIEASLADKFNCSPGVADLPDAVCIGYGGISLWWG